jgi:DNA modification methylase
MTAQLYQGDCIETMRGLPDGCVQTCVTSPPYYGLRDYGTATWEGGSAECDHRKNPEAYSDKAMAKSTIGAHSNTGHAQEGYKNVCGKCGAKRIDNQIGLEDTPDAYVAKLVDVFREVRRLLRDDGTLWLNLGDSYAATSRGTGGKTSSTLNAKRDEYGDLADDRKSQPWMDEAIKFDLHAAGLKPKDLIGIPWLVAFALRADGWYLRSDIIWHKPNPMPESVTDRPTKAHEYIFLLSKSREYFYDADAIREHQLSTPHTRDRASNFGKQGKVGNHLQGSPVIVEDGYRNKRSVWTVTTKPYAEAHFATFPPDLIEPCILAGSKVGDTVLDPFSGSGTTGAVSLKHGRKYIGCELNPEYIELSYRRIERSQPMLLEVPA